jgi:membrane-bound lytic murein transglycosylase F
MPTDKWERMQSSQHPDEEEARQGEARKGEARQGEARKGEARKDEAEESNSSSAPQHPLPPQLNNWRVMEIEGRAAPVEEERVRAVTPEDERAPANAADALTDQYDDLIVLTVANRSAAIAPGETGTISASLLNNGDHPLVFEVTAGGEVAPAWFPDLPLRVPLQPGERQVFTLHIAPPFDTQARAGDYAFAIAAASTAQPERSSRAVCALTIEPYTDFRLGILQPDRVTTTWWTPSAQTRLPITNLSNHDASFKIVGADAERACVFEFETPDDIYAQAGQATFALGPGERSSVGITILSRRQPAVGYASPESPFRIAVQMVSDDGQDRRQIVEGRVVSAALIGPWQMAVLAVIAVAVLATIMLTGAAMLLALRPGESQPVVAPTAPPAPAFALVLSMDAPVPTREPLVPIPAGEEAAPMMRAAPALVAGPEQGELPVVQADQVTAPGETIVEPQLAPIRPTPIAVVPSSAGAMTYAQMFQQIAARYDLNWQIVAAQGYVESGFDSTAIGRQGSLGLMQIHPNTWQEWAPLVDVSDPFDTYGNVLVAAIYLDYLRATLGKQGRPQTEWMLAAYNWGPDKVLGLLASGGEWTDLPVEVQQYATDVLRIAQSIPDY